MSRAKVGVLRKHETVPFTRVNDAALFKRDSASFSV